MAAKSAAAKKNADAPPDLSQVVASLVLTSQLVPYAMNSRLHSEKQIEQLAEAIKEFGWTSPVVADAKGIVAGHGRVMAAEKIYSAGGRIKMPNGALLPMGTVPVIDCTGWTDEQRRTYVIWDNKSSELSTWDHEKLKLEVRDLNLKGVKLELTGLSRVALSKIIAPEGANFAKESVGEGRILLLVEVEDEAAQQMLFEELTERGFQCKIT